MLFAHPREMALGPVLAACVVSGVAAGLLTLTHWAVPVAAALVLASAAVVVETRTARCGLALGAVLGASLAFGAQARDRAVNPTLVQWFDEVAGDSARTSDPVVVRGHLASDAARTEFGVRLLLDVGAVRETWGWRPAVGRVQAYVAGALAESRVGEWTAGRAIEVPVSLRRPQVLVNPGGSSAMLQALRRPYHLAGTVKSAALISVTPTAWSHEWAAGVRRHVRTAVARHFHREPQAAIVTAILIGDRAGLSDAVERRLQIAGTYHVIAISGGNVALLVLLTMGIVRLIVRPHRAGLCLAFVAVMAYGWVVGGEASVQRAVTAAAIYLLARLAGLVPRGLHVVATVAMLVVAVDPVAVVDVGAWLSFGATLAIVLYAEDLGGLFGRSKRLPRSLLGATLAAELALVPIGAAVFSRVTVAGLVLNFVAIPAMAVVQLAGLLTVLLDTWWTTAAWASAAVADLAAAGLLNSSMLVDVAPWLSWRVPPVPIGWTALYYLSWAATLGTFASASVRRISLAAAIGATLIIVTAPDHGRPGSGRLSVALLDVGQGDAIAVRFPTGESLLVDSGGSAGPFDVGGRVVTPALWALGIRRLDWLAITHADIDHIGGARAVLADLAPREVWEGVPVPRSRDLQELRNDAHRTGTAWRRVQAGDHLQIGSVSVEVLHPPSPDWERQKVRNDDSIVLRIQYGSVEFLLTGDAGGEFERRTWAADDGAMMRILKVAHHGSRTSSSAAFVSDYHPDLALVSAGRGNLFGHPAPDVLGRLVHAGAEVFRTDRDAALIVETDGVRVSVKAMSGRTWDGRVVRSGL